MVKVLSDCFMPGLCPTTQPLVGRSETLYNIKLSLINVVLILYGLTMQLLIYLLNLWEISAKQKSFPYWDKCWLKC